jgi:hypothetical protein
VIDFSRVDWKRYQKPAVKAPTIEERLANIERRLKAIEEVGILDSWPFRPGALPGLTGPPRELRIGSPTNPHLTVAIPAIQHGIGKYSQ